MLTLLTFRIGSFFAVVSPLIHCRVFSCVLDIHPLDTSFPVLIIRNASRYHQCPLGIGLDKIPLSQWPPLQLNHRVVSSMGNLQSMNMSFIF